MTEIRQDGPPRLVFAAPQGRSGKTTVSLGTCAALAARGLDVRPFKKGPDYIDPSWLSAAAGRPCRSLDPYFAASPEGLRRSLLKGARGADLALIEGNHGLFDSSLPEPWAGERGAAEGDGSTAAVARAMDAPVVLVLNAQRMGRSAAAVVHGCQTFEPGTNIAAVVLNNVANARHEAKLRRAIQVHCGIPVAGAIPRDEDLTIPDRHLGLVPRGEDDGLLPALAACREAAEKYLDLDLLLDLARQAPPLDDPLPARPIAGPYRPPVRLGVLRDRAFSFYYPENLEALAEAGAELTFIDALHDPDLPPVAGLYIGGGFPEMFMEELAANRSLVEGIRRAVADGLPVYAECGGLMYLCRGLRWGEKRVELVGALPFEVEMTDRPQGHGYVLARSEPGNGWLPAGSEVRGHEFHHSRPAGYPPDLPTAYRLERGRGLGQGRDGALVGQVLAAYTHLHADGCPEWAPSLVEKMR